MHSFLFPMWCLMAHADAGDPWARPEHLRVVRVPTERWSQRAAPQPARIFWDGEATATIALQQGSGWKILASDARSGFTTRPLPIDAQLRVRLAEGIRWSPVVSVEPVEDPVSTGVLGAWGGGDVVGQIALDVATGDVYASTVGGGLLVRRAHTQPLAGASARVGVWTAMGRADGLPDARVVAVDARDGVVLVGTAEGLAVMRDGAVVQLVDDGLEDPWVQAVHVGDDGAWWVGTFRGLSWKPEGADGFRTVLAPWSVFSLSGARSGGVWAGYEGLQHVSTSGTVTPWLEGLHVYDSVDTARGPVVATTEAGLLHVVEPQLVQSLSRVVDRDAFGVAVGPGGLWTAAGPAGLVDPSDNLWGRGAGLPADEVRSVLAMPDQSLFVGTDRGLARVVPREGVPLVDAAMSGRWPASTEVADIAVVKDGLWAAGSAGVQFAGHPQRSARDLVVAAGSDNRALVADPSGATWAVGDRVVRLDKSGQLDAWWPPSKVTRAAVQSGAGLYVGGGDGLWRLDEARGRFVPVSTLRQVRALASSARGLWVVADQSVFRVVGGAVVPYLQTGVPLCISESPDGAWVGTTDGLERVELDGEAPEVVDVLGEGDAGVGIVAVASDPSGVWFATDGGEVGRVVGQRVGLVSIEAVDAPDITSLAPDGDSVWVGTRAGVYRVWLPSSGVANPLPSTD